MPSRIYKVRGNVSTSTADRGGDSSEGTGLMIGAGGTLSLEFEENIAGRYAFFILFYFILFFAGDLTVRPAFSHLHSICEQGVFRGRIRRRKP